MKAGEVTQAEEIYKQVLSKFPKNKQAIQGYQSLTTPPQVAVDKLIGLFNSGRLKETVIFGQALAAQFPNAPILYEILGATNLTLGNTSETIKHYRKLLHLKPRHTDANNNLGMIYYDRGHFAQAAEIYQKVVEIEPKFADAHYNLGNAMTQMGDLRKAIESYEAAFAINPKDIEVLISYGNALKDYGNFKEAIEFYTKALQINPNLPDIKNNMDHALEQNSEIDKLALDYSKMTKKELKSPEVICFLGHIFATRNYNDTAIDKYKQALKIKPDYVKAHNDIGLCFIKKGNNETAMVSFKQALKVKPDYAEALINIGYLLRASGEFDTAIENYEKAIEGEPDFAEAYGNMGIAHRDNGNLIKAIESFNQAIKIKPELFDVHNNLGAALKDAGDLDAAMESYQKALKINPDYAEAHWNQSLVYLIKADFQNGWWAYEWRWKATDEIGKYLSTSKPIWRSRKGQRVLLWAEQGVGDEVMFASIIPDLHAVCSKLIVQIDERLIPLFRRSFPSDIDYRTRDEVVSENDYDTHIPMGSLPQQFRQTIESFKSTSLGWLSACDVKANGLREKLLTDKSEILIGISWHSTKPRLGAEAKVISLTQLAKKLHAPKIKLVNLQYGDVSDELGVLSEEHGIEIIQLPEIDNKNDIDGLAALIMACDKVVSISNLTIHLAGALGKEAHVLLASSNDWRWGQNRNSSYWYDSVRLHRQTKINDWDAVLKLL